MGAVGHVLRYVAANSRNEPISGQAGGRFQLPRRIQTAHTPVARGPTTGSVDPSLHLDGHSYGAAGTRRKVSATITSIGISMRGMMGDQQRCGQVSQKTVLVVEDNELNAKLYCDLLNARGYRVLHTKYGTVAFEMARRVKPDLIVMDIQLPDGSGLQVTSWLKQDKSLRWIPVIAVTGFAHKGDKEKILEGGCDAYMSIPISVTEFLEAIKTLSGTRSVAAARC